MKPERDSIRLAARLLTLSVLVMRIPSLNCQFISHINAKGLKGNLTFDVVNETSGNVLVIEGILKSEHNWNKDLDGIDPSQPVLFDWTLHSNTLYPSMLQSCQDENLGSELLKSSLTINRPLVLDTTNRWTISLKEFLATNSAVSLSALIWGKSIRLSLSKIHKESLQSKITDSPDVSSAISKPQLNPTTNSGQNKPVFAPRPKPSLSAKARTTVSPSLPQPEALVAETTATIAPILESKLLSGIPDNATQKEAVLDATHKRISKAFSRVIVCGNIVDTRNVKTAEAIFESQVAGKVTMRGNEDDTTLIMLNLYHVRSKLSTRHDWKILASDILDNRRHEEKCRYLQVLFDPNNIDDSKCKRNETTHCRMGDLTKKHGQIQVAGQGKNLRTTLVDLNLPLSALEGSRSLFLVVYEFSSGLKSTNTTPNILSCAQIRSANSRRIEASFNMNGVRGSIKFSQRHFTEPTFVTYDLFGLEGNTKHQSIRELPLSIRTSNDNSKLCNSLGDVYDPFKLEGLTSDKTTVDFHKVGNLSAKHGQLSVIDSEYEDHYVGEYMDLSIQLYGPLTVVGRSIVVHKNNGENWVCASLDYIDEPVSMAAAVFRYPVVGQITFRQLTEDPHSETGVLIELYNPNSEKNSEGHDWKIHLRPAMADFYNWSQRCMSSDEIYDPIGSSTGLTNELYSKQCQAGMLNEPLRCRSGDTSLKSGIKLSLPISHLNRERIYYTDQFLPLAKLSSIIGRSVVIYDEHAPTQRGNRLACSTIKSMHPLKASIKTWNSGPSIPSNVLGSVVFEQESAARPTKIKVDLSGFNGNVENYAIHNVWTSEDREFPCSNDSLYDIYDPFDIENSLNLHPSAHYGSLATVDRVKVGDMSRKHGSFEGLPGSQRSITDANLPLFASHSIIGRSMVLRAAVNDFRWVCGTIELDYDKGESREIIGIASFDDPRSKISGYVRLVQLEYKDGSCSDTFIQVDLRMHSDGVHELQTSNGHNWAIFVNQVGADAFIPADDVRCIAAGFKWNPYLAQDNLDVYLNSCSPSEHLACAMGDLGQRHGHLSLGPNNRRTMSDINLPLVGNYSVMGRSLVVFDNKRPSVKLACANIFPDIHLKSNVVIKRTPSFTVARFVEQMRSLLDAAEWLMVPELKATKPVANGECVQMTIHFYGQKAHQMQVELNNLITLGTVRKSSRNGGEKISTHYKLCRAGQMQLTSSALSNQVSQCLICIFLALVCFVFDK